MRVSIADELVDRLEQTLPSGGDVPTEVDRLLRLVMDRPGYRPGDPLLVLTAADLDRLTQALNRSILPASVDQLIGYADRLGKLQLGEVRVSLSQGQLEEVAHRAEREQQTVAQYLARMAAAWASNFFTMAPVREDVPVVEHRTIEIEATDVPDARAVVQVVG